MIPRAGCNEGLVRAGKLPSFDSHAFNGAIAKESWASWLLPRTMLSDSNRCSVLTCLSVKGGRWVH